jgi:O-antigen/teichoic acid export membrane protein
MKRRHSKEWRLFLFISDLLDSAMRTDDPRSSTPAPGPLRNFAALGSSEVIGRAVGFYATALLARKLGVDAFGYVGFAIAIVSYFGVALNVGFADIGARDVARNPGAATQIAADATAIRLLIAFAGILAIGVAVVTFDFAPHQPIVLLLSSLSLIAVALDTTWVYRGLSRNRTAGLALFGAQLAYLAGVVFIVRIPHDVPKVPLIQFAGDTLAALVLLALLFRHGFVRPSLSGGMHLVRQSGFITISRLLRTLIVTFDVLLLGIIAGARDVGLYTAAYRVCLLITTVAVATHVVFLPLISRAALETPRRVSEVLSRSLSLTSAVVLPLTIGGIIVSRPLLIFFFGPEYSAGANAFRLLLASIAVLSIHGTMHNVFIAQHETRREAVIFGAGAVLNMGLNLALIPHYGLTGAAFATLAAEAFILVASAFALSKWNIELSLSRTFLPLAASLAMAAALVGLRNRFPVWSLIPLGGAVYLVVFGAAGGIRQLRHSGLTANPAKY